MKKLISLLLVLCILCPLLSGCVYFDKYLMIKKAYLEQFEIKDKKPEDVIVDYDGGTYNGARIVMLDAEWHNPAKWSETIAEVNIKYYDSNCLYAYKNEKFYTLAEAYEKHILYSNDIVSIAEKFNKEITHYRDTCDKHDFPKGKIIEVHESDKQYINYGTIYLYFAPSLLGGTGIGESGEIDATPLREYLGCDIITGIEIVKSFFYHSEIPEYRVMLAIVLLKKQTKECAEYVMNEIVRIPGVLGASFIHSINTSFEATNGDTYSNNEYWWLDYIQVEKVWDFTTGSQFICK